METVSVALELPVSAPLSSSVRALEAARDAQTDPRAKQALAAVAALASRGLVQTIESSVFARRTAVDPAGAVAARLAAASILHGARGAAADGATRL